METKQKYLAAKSSPENIILSSSIAQSNNHPTAVLLDWDGTVTSSNSAYQFIKDEIENKLISEGYIRNNNKMPPPGSGLTDEQFFMSLFEDSTPNNSTKEAGKRAGELIIEYSNSQETVDKIINNIKIRDNACDFIRSLQENHIPIAIVSNSNESRTQKIVNHIFTENGLEPIAVIGKTPDNEGKPAPSLINKALDKLNVKASDNVYMIGDNLKTDIYAAINADCSGILIGQSPQEAKADKPIDHQAQQVIKNGFNSKNNPDDSKAVNIQYVKNYDDLKLLFDKLITPYQKQTIDNAETNKKAALS